MKLLLTLDFPPEKGGIQHYLYERVAHCYNANDRVCAAGCGYAAELYAALPCPVVPGTRRAWRALKKLALIPLFILFVKQWFSRRGDIVVECGNVYTALIPWALTFFVCVPYHIFTYGTELLACRRRNPLAAMLRAALRRAAGIYVLGAYGKAIVRTFNVACPITTEPPRLERARFVIAEKRRPPDEPATLLSVGRLVPHKGHAVLIRALALLRQTDTVVRCVIIGEGPQKATLIKLARELNLDKKVTLCGSVDDRELQRRYERSALFVLPSLELAGGTEGFGIVLLEAMARGLPIIASNAGGIKEVLDNGACGVLVAPGDPAALARAITGLLHDKSLQQRLTEAAYQRLQEYYIWK